ncbi:hypothetical protein VW35_16365 [Devosia soli]|uniref:DUF6460 domain-containing protein n=1 Tax=Devosia soli TaxID=361041 RepID=A0A0F5L3E6_9HYPH|nr:DUF6460 domain-containing protein [Devosia soli]KKB76888.1 hypothetical protein VW35_16365 [Devosia soli]
MTEDSRPASRSGLERLLGDRPGSLVIKLVLISLLVGFVMSVFGFDAADLVRGAADALRDALRDGGAVFRQLGGYIATGAAIVLPIWLILRLLKRR